VTEERLGMARELHDFSYSRIPIASTGRVRSARRVGTDRATRAGAGLLLAGHDRRSAGVALNGRMRAQNGLELHAPGHREHGRGEEGDQRAGERAEAAASAENGET
jgi:hypothetical protein